MQQSQPPTNLAVNSLSSQSASFEKCTIDDIVVVIPPGVPSATNDFLVYSAQTHRFSTTTTAATGPTGPAGSNGAPGAPGLAGLGGELTNTGPTGPTGPGIPLVPTVINFTSSQSWTIPTGVHSVFFNCLGGGGGGGSYYGQVTAGGGGGAASGVGRSLSFAPGDVVTLTVGAGGAGATQFVNALNGEDSIVAYGITQLIVAPGGLAVTGNENGGNGAFGGGGGGSILPFTSGGLGGLAIGSSTDNDGGFGFPNGRGGNGGGGGGLGGPDRGGGGGGGGVGGGSGGSPTPSAGQPNSGSGGGGAGYSDSIPSANGANGGSGIISVSYFLP